MNRFYNSLLTSVNSMVCVQLMLQTKFLWTVLALIGFFPPVLLLVGLLLTPCAGLTCANNVIVTGETWPVSQYNTVQLKWFNSRKTPVKGWT